MGEVRGELVFEDITFRYAVRKEFLLREVQRRLGDEVRLVYMPESERRAVNPKRARAGDIVSFADAYPFLIISEAIDSPQAARVMTIARIMWRAGMIDGQRPRASSSSR